MKSDPQTDPQTDPPRYSPGWIARIPLMAYRKYRTLRAVGTITYSQCGEDILAQGILDQIGIPRPLYMDVGAYDPRHLSNTYRFYRRGCTGLLVEPNPHLFARLKRVRRRDTCLLAGLSDRTEAGPSSTGCRPRRSRPSRGPKPPTSRGRATISSRRCRSRS